MKFELKILTAVAALSVSFMAQAAKKDVDPVKIPYFLPSTVLRIEVEAETEVFHAGIYAKYAQKYLGIDVRQQDARSCRITGVTVTSYTEADRSVKYNIPVEMLPVVGDFLKYKFSDEEDSGQPVSASTVHMDEFSGTSVPTAISLPHALMKARTVEQKAAELAGAIFEMRTTRVNIITGNTDATYSGSAMGAAFNEISKLESEYMSLFTGYSERTCQKMTFDIVPEKGDTLFVAFRVSDSDGLFDARSMYGRAVNIEIIPQEVAPAQNISKNDKTEYAFYRIPAACTIRITDGKTLLFCGRQTIYQLGTQAAIALPVIKK